MDREFIGIGMPIVGKSHLITQRVDIQAKVHNPPMTLCGKHLNLLCNDDWGWDSYKEALATGQITCLTCRRMICNNY